MHELAITEHLVRMVTEKANEAGAETVTRVRLVIGERSGYVNESLKMYFGIMSEGTICAGAELEFETTEGNEFYLDSIEVAGE